MGPDWSSLGTVWFSSEAYPFQILLLAGGIFLGAVLCQSVPSGQKRYLFRLFVIAYLSRIFICYLLYFISCFSERVGAFLGADDYVYMCDGLGISRLLDAGIPLDLLARNQEIWISSRDGSFGYIMHLPFTMWNIFLFQWLGNHPLSALVTNCLIGALLIFALFFMGMQLFGPRAGKIAATLGAFYPSNFLWSTQDLKDPLFNLTIILMFLFFIRLRENHHFIYLILIGITIYWAGLLRSPFQWVFLGLLTATAVATERKVYKIIPFVFILVLLFLPYFRETAVSPVRLLVQQSQQFLSGGNELDSFNKGNQILAETQPPLALGLLNKMRKDRQVGTAFLANLEITNWGKLFCFLPVFLFAVLTVPYPWEATNPMIALASMEMALWYFLIPATLWGVWFGVRKRFSKSLCLLFPILSYAVFIGMIQNNVGLMVRFRGIVLLVLFVFTGVGLAYRKIKLGGQLIS